MTGKFSSKTVLVTGGGGSIGRAVALAFAREDAAVVVAGRSAEPLDETVKIAEADGGHAAAITVDVTDSHSVARLVAQTVERHGRLDD